MAEKSRPKIKAAEGFAVVSDWSEHPDVKKAIASGNISAIETATKKARDEGRNVFKPKDKAVPISELKEAYEADKAREAARLSRIEAVRENARTMSRYREQKQTYKQQSKAREERAAGGYDATPTNRYGQPIESFWAKEPPAMPEMRPVPAMPEVPQMPVSTISSQLNARNMPFYGYVQSAMRPYYRTSVQDYRPTQYGPYSETGGYTLAGSNYPTGKINYVLPWNAKAYERWKNIDTPISGSNLLSGTENVGYALKPPMFPYWPRVY